MKGKVEATQETPHRGWLIATTTCLCPRCREGRLFRYGMSFRFKKNLEMHDHCPVCGQVTDIEVGFYYGTGYVSYLLGILITIACFLLWLLIIGFSFQDNRFLYWVIFNSLLLIAIQPWLMRFSRSLWLAFFVKYDPDWKNHRPEDPERIIKEQMNNW